MRAPRVIAITTLVGAIVLTFTTGCSQSSSPPAGTETSQASTTSPAQQAGAAPAENAAIGNSGCNASTIAKFVPDNSDQAIISGGVVELSQLYPKMENENGISGSSTIGKLMPIYHADDPDPVPVKDGVICPDGNVYQDGTSEPVMTDVMLVVRGEAGEPYANDQLGDAVFSRLPAGEVLNGLPCPALVQPEHLLIDPRAVCKNGGYPVSTAPSAG